MQGTESKELLKIIELVKEIEFAMLTTRDEDGTLRSRPMATQKTEFDGKLYFFTRENCPKVDEMERNPQVGISYSNFKKQAYVSMSGTAEISKDRELMKKLWSPLYKAWFSKGLDDPELSLLCIQVNKAEYWSSGNAGFVQLFGWVQSALTGKPLQKGQAGEHEKLDLTT